MTSNFMRSPILCGRGETSIAASQLRDSFLFVPGAAGLLPLSGEVDSLCSLPRRAPSTLVPTEFWKS